MPKNPIFATLILASFMLAGCILPDSWEPRLPPSARVIDDFVSNNTGDRTVFVELPENEFIADAVWVIVETYRRECVPVNLRIIILSDPVLLARRIDLERNPIAVDFANGEPGRKAAERFWEQQYWPTGSYVAVYQRDAGHEFYSYRLSANEGPKVNVDMKVKGRKVCGG